jgi:hypothetical protein
VPAVGPSLSREQFSAEIVVALAALRRSSAGDRAPPPACLRVSARRGPSIVPSHGAKRLLGPYSDESWPPHGLFVAAVRGRVCSPSIRTATFAGHCHSTGDHRLFCSAAAVAPAWYPSACEPSSPSPTRKRAFTSRTPTAAARFGGFASTHRATLVWTHDGGYLISVSSQGTLTAVSHSGRRLGANHSAAGIDAIAVATARDAYAVAGHGGLGQSTVVINDLQSHRTRRVFSGRGR